jgi:hypothetical protein
MTTLYKRATPPQWRILRIVEGAVKSMGDAHPEARITHRMARSIAKRAAGTLTAQWPDVLTAKRSPLVMVERARLTALEQIVSRLTKERSRSASGLSRRAPLLLLRGQIRHMMKAIKNSGNVERANAMIEVLRMIAKLEDK